MEHAPSLPVGVLPLSQSADAGAATAAAQALLFQRLRWQMLRNSMRSVMFSSSLRLGMIVLLSLMLWGGVFAMGWFGFRFLLQQEEAQRFAYVGAMCVLLFDVLFLVLGIMLIFSGGIILFSSLFSSAETGFLLATPARADQLFGYKFQGSVGFSSWAFIVLGSPVIIVYGIVFGAPWYFYALLPLFALGFVLLAGSLGGLACLLIVSFVPQRRKQVFVFLIAAIFLAFAAWGFRVVQTARHVHWTHDAVKEVLNEFRFTQSFPPSHWITQGLMAARKGDLQQTCYRLALVMSNGLFLYVVTAWLSARLYRRGFDRLTTGGQLRKRYGGAWLDGALNRMLGFLAPQTRLLIVKDFRAFRRDPAQWAQIGILFGLTGLYFFNIRRFYTENLGGDITTRFYQNGVSLINLAATALLLASYTGRFIYPMLSLEGRKFWILGLLPLQRDRLLWGKFAFSATWSFLSAEALILVSDIMLGVPAIVVAVHALTIAVIALGLSGISVGLGAAMPNFRESDPSKIAVGFGGTLNLVAGLLFLLVEVLLMAGPWHLRMAYQGFTSSRMFDVWALISLALGLVVGGIAVGVPMRMGARTLRQMEF